jgi:hypothetical protein
MRKLGIVQKRIVGVGKADACAGVENPDGVPGALVQRPFESASVE